MQRIRMRTTACGPDGNLMAGQVYEIPAERAQALIAGGSAEPEPKAAGESAPASSAGAPIIEQRAATEVPPPRRRSK